MNVKLVVYAGERDVINDGIVMLFCPTINENICSFYDVCSYSPNLSFNAKNFPNNTEWRFQVLDINTGAISTIFNGELCVYLEFIQFADK